MAITKSDLLYYLHPKVGGYEPMVGSGQVTFSRGGPKWYLTRNKRLARGGAGTVPVAWVPGSVPVRRTAVLDLERGVTPVTDDSVRFDSNSAWGRFRVGAEQAVPSIVDDLPTNGEARQITQSGSGALQIQQSVGTFTGLRETAIAIYERVDQPTSTVQIFDDSGGSSGGTATYDWATDTVSTGDADSVVGREIITEFGPNGGRVVLLWIRSPTVSGNSRRIIYKPAGTETDGDTCIIHGMWHTELAFPTSLRPYVGSPQSRQADSFHVSHGLSDHPVLMYLSWIATASPNANKDGAAERVLATRPSGGNPGFSFNLDFGGTNQLHWIVEDGSGNTFNIAVATPADPGQHIEAIGIIRADASGRLITRVDGGAVSSNSAAALAGSWAGHGGRDLWYNELPGGGQVGATKVARHYFADIASPDAPTDGSDDAALMDEMAAYHLAPAA